MPWAAVYSHIPQESLIHGVVDQHIDAFPKDFFKTRWLDNKRSIQNMYRGHKYMNAMKLPAVIASYDISDNPTDTLEQSDYYFNYASHFIAGPLDYYYWRIYSNPVTGVKLYAAFTRKRITINFRYILPDVFMRDDIYTWMLNTFRYGGPHYNYGTKRSIYSAIPSSIIDYIGAIQGYSAADFKKYESEIMEYSSGLITKHKVNMKDDQEMFFLVYRMPRMKIIQDDKPEKADGETKGQLKASFEINESLSFEPNFPQMYILETPEVVNGRIVPTEYKPSIFDAGNGYDSRILKTNEFIINPVFDYFHDTHYSIISSFEFVEADGGEEELDIDGELYGPMHLNLIKDIVASPSQRLHMNTYYEIYVYKRSKQLLEGVDYEVNWEKMKVYLHKTQKDCVYRIVAVADRKALKARMENVLVQRDTEEEDSSYKVDIQNVNDGE